MMHTGAAGARPNFFYSFDYSLVHFVVISTEDEPSAGAVIETVGATLIVTVIAVEPGAPWLSVTDAVIVCEPAVSDDVENEPPVPIAPSALEVQLRPAVSTKAFSGSSMTSSAAAKATALA